MSTRLPSKWRAEAAWPLHHLKRSRPRASGIGMPLPFIARSVAMPSEREKQNQGQGRQNGGASQGMRERIQNMGQHVAESAGDIGHRVGEGFSSAQEEMMQRYRRAE